MKQRTASHGQLSRPDTESNFFTPYYHNFDINNYQSQTYGKKYEKSNVTMKSLISSQYGVQAHEAL